MDEIGEIPPQAQIKLLRVLQDTHTFERLGGERSLKVDVRILAATNKDLLREVQKSLFHEDLFYRLNVIPIFCLPSEIAPMIFLSWPLLSECFSVTQRKDIHDFSPRPCGRYLTTPGPATSGNWKIVWNMLSPWPKGVELETADLPTAIRGSSMPAPSSPLIVENERALLERVLAECKWEKKKAARRLGMGRSTLYSKLKKYGIVKPTLQ